MLCPDDAFCEQVMPWDGKDECQIFGESLCPIKIDEGKCLPVRLLDHVGGLMSGNGGSNKDVEHLCYCDADGVEYIQEITIDFSKEETDPDYRTVINRLPDGSIYTPVGDSVKGPLPKKIVSELIVPSIKVVLKAGEPFDISGVVPADATGATISFINNNTCCQYKVSLDGSDPETNGELITHEDTICLGCTPSSSGSSNDVSLLKILAQDECESCALIKFYKSVIVKG